MLEFYVTCDDFVFLIFEARASSLGWTLGKQEKEIDANMELHHQGQGSNYSATVQTEPHQGHARKNAGTPKRFSLLSWSPDSAQYYSYAP